MTHTPHRQSGFTVVVVAALFIAMARTAAAAVERLVMEQTLPTVMEQLAKVITVVIPPVAALLVLALAAVAAVERMLWAKLLFKILLQVTEAQAYNRVYLELPLIMQVAEVEADILHMDL